MKQLLLVFVGLVVLSHATVYFQEDFSEGWENRWVVSKVKESDGTLGQWKLSTGKYGDQAGIQTSEDARFYQISAKLPSSFSNKDKTLVIQYRVKYEQVIDCGGAYIKLLPAGLDQTKFEGESAYNVMFGPDVCGATKRIHAILNYKGQNHLIKKTVAPETDQHVSHLYTFILRPDQTYEILVDGESKASGSILDDWDLLPPKKIKDPNVSKPADWVDDAKIADPEAKKPDGWDDIPKEIADPEAKKPEDWDDELDGEWEVPQIPNPEYKGEWKAPMIDNPAYKGPWVHPEIDNPDYKEDSSIYAYESSFLGIEIWQVKSGTIFDNFLVTDSVDEAKAFADGAFKTLQEAEKAAKTAEEEQLRKQAEQEQKEAAASEGKDDDDDDDEKKGHGHDHDHEL